MCSASSECAGALGAACVAGRCQVEGAGVKPAVAAARRVIVRPDDLAFVRSGPSGGGGGPAPDTAVLGRDDGVLLFHFPVPLARDAEIVEAYLVLHRDDRAADDPDPVELHAMRIVEAWDGRASTAAFAPRLVDVRAPKTQIRGGRSSLVRLDVGELVRRFRSKDPIDHGIAVVAEGTSTSGVTFVLASDGASNPRAVPWGARQDDAPVPDDPGPYLEIYLR